MRNNKPYTELSASNINAEREQARRRWMDERAEFLSIDVRDCTYLLTERNKTGPTAAWRPMQITGKYCL